MSIFRLIRKELSLAMHPTVIAFAFLGALLLIPNYPYTVSCFYTGLSIFFVCFTGRENSDIEYTLTLPVSRRDVVRGRLGFGVTVQCIHLVLAVPFALISQTLIGGSNIVGIDANITFFAFSLLLHGVFNITFYPRYYRKPTGVGAAFVVSSIVTFAVITLLEVTVHAIPYVRDILDTPDSLHVLPKLISLAIGLAVYVVLTAVAYKVSVDRFEMVDI